MSNKRRVFQNKLYENYFYLLLNENNFYHVCIEMISVMKEYNMQQHYLTKYSTYETCVG